VVETAWLGHRAEHEPLGPCHPLVATESRGRRPSSSATSEDPSEGSPWACMGVDPRPPPPAAIPRRLEGAPRCPTLGFLTAAARVPSPPALFRPRRALDRKPGRRTRLHQLQSLAPSAFLYVHRLFAHACVARHWKARLFADTIEAEQDPPSPGFNGPAGAPAAQRSISPARAGEARPAQRPQAVATFASSKRPSAALARVIGGAIRRARRHAQEPPRSSPSAPIVSTGVYAGGHRRSPRPGARPPIWPRDPCPCARPRSSLGQTRPPSQVMHTKPSGSEASLYERGTRGRSQPFWRGEPVLRPPASFVSVVRTGSV